LDTSSDETESVTSLSSTPEVKEVTVTHSVLEAIRAGIWDFEPDNAEQDAFEATQALPGSSEKLAVLTRRVALGLPLWHPADRRTCDDSTAD
jgi:hypothetical protein